MAGPSAPSGEHSRRAAPPPAPSVPTPCRAAPAPELPVRFAAARRDQQAAACPQRIVTNRVGEEGKCPPTRGFAPGTVVLRNPLIPAWYWVKRMNQAAGARLLECIGP